MAILINTNVKGQTQEGYDQVLTLLHDLIQKSPGFILHSSYPSNDGWAVVEVWNSKGEADQFYAKHVTPNLPKGIVPKRSYQELHSIVTPSS